MNIAHPIQVIEQAFNVLLVDDSASVDDAGGW
jgi:hypothetical protein